MAVQWTKDQKDAIDARGVSLMVSAAAGSGKTSVLTQRIVSLLSEKDAVHSSRLAVVTFTKAAAKSLEEKLYQALSDLVAKNPENTQLSQQLMGLSRAQISTIHSFCYALIRSYRKEIGLGENLRIADEGRIEPLKKKAVEEAVEEFLAEKGDFSERRRDLCRIFGTARSLSGLYDSLYLLFEKTSFLPGGISTLKEKCKSLEKEAKSLETGHVTLSETAFGKDIAEEGIALFEKGHLTLEALLSPLEKTQAIGEKYEPFLTGRSRILRDGADRIRKGDFFGAAKSLEEGFEESLPRISKCPPEEKDIKDSIAEIHNRLKKELLAFSRSHLEKPLPSLIEEVKESILLTEEFLLLGEMAQKKFSLEKEKKGFLDYADLENLALSLVAEKKDGVFQKSPLGEKITEEFDAVFVDEYQDSNAIQDLIFRCVTKKDNLFIVGDPKQSIYRFRGAEPEIFSSYKNTLPRYPSEKGGMQTIFLSDNFRCEKPIIDLVNRVFRVMMDRSDPNSLYKEEDELRQGKKEEKKAPQTELCLMEKEEEEEKEVYSDAAQLIREEDIEAKYIAARCRNLLETYSPEKIAVICRTHRQIAKVRESLENLNIPCSAGKGDSLSSQSEYLFLHSLLLALDNPDGDVPLLGALLSPVFRFSSDDLYAVRQTKKEGSFYSALNLLSEKDHPLSEKCREALETLRELREKSKALTLPALIFHLYTRLSITELFPKKDRRIKEFFLKNAENAESVGEYSLSDFAAYLDRVVDQSTEEEEESGGIALMTIHKSKGLEFPVVFASFLAQRFDTRDETSKLIVSPGQGVVFHLPADGGRIRKNTFLRKGAALSLRKGMLQEEKRVLYVALTRAAEKLIITANPRSYASLNRDLLTVCEKSLDSALLRHLTDHADSPLMMLLLALRESPALRKVLEGGREAEDGSLKIFRTSPPEASPYEKRISEEESFSLDGEKILSDLSFAYESKGLDTLPEKLSVSQLLREEREEEASLSPRRLLDFDRAVLCTNSAMIGTLTHKVMQFADLAALEKDAQGEYRRLEEKGFMTKEELSLVEKDKIKAFFSTPLYQRLKNSPKLVREKRFNVLLPAKEILDKEGEILIQGVVDAWFENPDSTLTLLDFKTDRVRKEDGEEVLRRRHEKQLRLYARAVEEMTGKKVSCLFLYSFSLEKEVVISRN